MTNSSENKPILFDYFESTAEVLLSQYNRSSLQNASTNLGRNRELFCSEFLSKVLPTKLSVKSGEIWDSSNNKTGQLDLIIRRDDAPTLHIGSDDIYLAEGVFCVIEIKSNLTREKLKESGLGLLKVKNLNLTKMPSIGTEQALYRPLRIVFAYTGATWETIVNEIMKNHWDDLFDLICILDKGVLVKTGNLIKSESNRKFILYTQKAASLGFLFLYLATYSSSFLGLGLNFVPYFYPLKSWDNEIV
ncbi:MAG: hypothetical protein PHV39_00775 [Methanomicrobium sp.]|nr:hypothetical protein [Methanomicrobium sp.]